MSQTTKPAWWTPESAFFGPLYLEADDSFRTFFAGQAEINERTATEVDGIERLCSLPSGARVIDCPCGYGRHSIELARRGHQVTSVDINPYFLQLARERADAMGVPIDFRSADMRELPSIEPVNAIINMFYSFGFFDDVSDDLRVLEGFRSRLGDGGKMLIHTMITVSAFEDGRIPAMETRELRSGRRLRSLRMFDPASRREVGRWSIFHPNGEEDPLPVYSVRIYLPQELEELCLKAGFSSVNFYGDWDGTPYRDDSPYLIVVAEA
ncbi:class I SAM-dependent methyltransferase [Microbispora sp. NPDC046973]|uniref:class I SAM-dependent methyltransferase n=1 Tax=Microbispora sp. NPDC046973 TaxID=3155022 RepID=UPI0033CB5241